MQLSRDKWESLCALVISWALLGAIVIFVALLAIKMARAESTAPVIPTQKALEAESLLSRRTRAQLELAAAEEALGRKAEELQGICGTGFKARRSQDQEGVASYACQPVVVSVTQQIKKQQEDLNKKAAAVDNK